MVECTVECGRLCKIQRLSGPHGSALVNLHVIPVLAPTLSAVVQILFFLGQVLKSLTMACVVHKRCFAFLRVFTRELCICWCARCLDC